MHLRWNGYTIDFNQAGNLSVWDSFEDYLTPGSATAYSIPLVTDIDDSGDNTNINEAANKYFYVDIVPHNGKIVGAVKIFLEPGYTFRVDSDEDGAQDDGWVLSV